MDTTTNNLSKGFNSGRSSNWRRPTRAAPGAGVNNLALIAPNVSSSGGVGVGTGGSVGGQRPRNNNFVVDGVDNNDKSVTGSQSYISPEEVAEFSLLQNQFSAEFGRSNGGQFITVTKSGTNQFHGSFYGFFRNRYLNALDNLQKTAGVIREAIRLTETTSCRVRTSSAPARISAASFLPRSARAADHSRVRTSSSSSRLTRDFRPATPVRAGRDHCADGGRDCAIRHDSGSRRPRTWASSPVFAGSAGGGYRHD